MKTIYTLLLFVFAFAAFPQAPFNINYQGVARDPNGQVLSNQSLGLKFEIFEGPNSVRTFSEVVSVTSNALGLFNHVIGSANGVLANVDWRNGPVTMQVSMDANGGTSYAAIGSPQTLVSVPYALNARYASNTPPPVLGISGSTLTVNGSTIDLGASPTSTLTLVGTSVAGSTIGLVNGNSVTIPNPTITGSGATVATPTLNGYNVFTPSVTLTGGTTIFGQPVPSGLAQVMGTYPNYSVIVTPTVTYSQLTGSLTLASLPGTSPAYSSSYYITPAPGLLGDLLYIGPTSNAISMNPIAPWRWNQTSNTVTLATVSPPQSVGINTNTPACALDVVGYTKMGANAPRIQLEKITGFTAAANTSTSFPIPAYITQNKIISVSVMVDVSTGNTFDWVHPNYAVPGMQFNWRISNQFVVVENVSGNSANIAGKAVRILITYEQ